MLHEHDARTLRRLRAAQFPLLAAGALLFLLGALYMLWSVGRLRETPARLEHDAFDRPVAQLARLAEAAEDRLGRVRPTTPLEASLLDELRGKTDATGRLALFVLRLLIGSVGTTVGLALLATALAQRPLLGILRRLGV
jgi:hypothetical protein